MKNRIITLSIIAATFALLAACGSNQEQNKTPETAPVEQAAVYQCPMQCEGDKTYDKAGTCPVCGMDLQLVDKKASTPEESRDENKSDSV